MQDVTEEIRESNAALTAILGDAPHRVWKVEGPDATGAIVTREYVQEELSFFAKQDFFNLVGGFIDKFVKGELGISMKDLFSGDFRQRMQIPTNLSAEEQAAHAERMVNENVELIQAVLAVVQKLPDLQKGIFMLALGVPPNERAWATGIITGPVSRGGATDDQAFEILRLFIRYNSEPIRRFFSEKGAELVEEFRSEVLGEEEKPPEEKEETTTEPEAPAATPGGTPSSTMQPAPVST